MTRPLPMKSTMIVESRYLPSRGRSCQKDRSVGRSLAAAGVDIRPPSRHGLTPSSGFQPPPRPRIACAADDSHSGLVSILLSTAPWLRPQERPACAPRREHLAEPGGSSRRRLPEYSELRRTP